MFSITVAEVLDHFLQWLVKHPKKAKRTFMWYRDYLQSFLSSLPEPEAFTVDSLTPADVYSWNNRGQAKLRLGDRTGAIADFRKALELRSDLHTARESLQHLGAVR